MNNMQIMKHLPKLLKQIWAPFVFRKNISSKMIKKKGRKEFIEKGKIQYRIILLGKS